MTKKDEKIVAFGEIMLRLTPPDYTTISEAQNFIANYGGGEANVLVSLAHFDHNVEFLTRIPDNPLGDSVIKHLKGNGVNTEHIIRASSNLGMYFVETGFGGRPSRVIYNRKHSAITRIMEDEIDYDEIFSDATWFHLSGITLALGENVRKVAIRCLQTCRKYGVRVSFDFNYRSTLWTIEEATPYFREIIPYVNVLFANYFDIHTILGYEIDETGMSDLEKQIAISKKLIDSTNVDYVFGTNRTVHTATDNSLSSYCIDTKGIYHEEGPIRFSVYDRIGGGDAFASGVIHGLCTDYADTHFALKFGLAASILKHTLYGDVSTLSVKEVEDFMENGTGAIRR